MRCAQQEKDVERPVIVLQKSLLNWAFTQDKVDIWALGCIIFELCTGLRPVC